VASIEQIIDFTIQAVFTRITILTPKYGYNHLLQVELF
jgi:hypothetical protein